MTMIIALCQKAKDFLISNVYMVCEGMTRTHARAIAYLLSVPFVLQKPVTKTTVDIKGGQEKIG